MGAERSKEKDLAQPSPPTAISTSRAAKQMSGGALLLPSTIAETVSKGGQETSSSGPPSNASSADSFKLEIKQEPFEEGSTQPAESSSAKGLARVPKERKPQEWAWVPSSLRLTWVVRKSRSLSASDRETGSPLQNAERKNWKRSQNLRRGFKTSNQRIQTWGK